MAIERSACAAPPRGAPGTDPSRRSVGALGSAARWALLALAALALQLTGCGDSGGTSVDADAGAGRDAASDTAADAAPLPASITVRSGRTTVTYELAGGRLALLHDGELRSEASAGGDAAFGSFGFGLAEPYNALRYYNPAAPPKSVSFAALGAPRSVERDGDKHTVRFAGGATLVLAPGAVSGSVSLRVSAARAPAAGATTPQTVLTRACLGARPDEVFFGFGEVFDTVAARGVIREMQILVDSRSDSGLNEVHVPVPFALSPRGWAMLVNDFHAGAFDVAKSRADRICATFHTHRFELLLMTAAQPLALVERLSALTSRPALPPRWAFGLHQWRNVLASQAELLADAKAMRDNKLPASVVWIDNPWQTGYNTFEFDTAQFPDIKGAVSSLAADGYKVLVWSTPNLDVKQSALYQQAAAAGYLMGGADGKPVSYRWGASDKGTLVDFSAPGAQAFWRGLIKRATDVGISGFKLDYGEEAAVAVGAVLAPFTFHGGRSTATMHREYPGLYHETYLGALPPGDGFIITRAGSLGEQRVNTAIWPGDLDSNFTTHADGRVGGLPAAITGGLSLGVSGYPFYGSDIGGFRKGLPTSECLERWGEYAALGTIMQLGGGGKNHNPWDTTLYDAATLPRFRRYARLHVDLFPTIYSLAVAASKTGRPVNVPLGLAYADDKQTWQRNFTFLLGEDVLVAPVIVAGATKRRVYLPAGKWIHRPHLDRDGAPGAPARKLYDGKREVEVDAPRGELPLFVRQGAIVGLLASAVDTLAPASNPKVTSYDAHADELLLHIVPGVGAAKTTRRFFDGSEVSAVTTASDLRVTIAAGSQHRDFRLRVDWRHRGAGPATPSAVTLGGKALAQVASAAATSSCSGGCWFYDAAGGWLHGRVLGAGEVVVR